MAKKCGHGGLHLRHAGGTTDHDDALDIGRRQARIAQHLAGGRNRAVGQLAGRLRELLAGHLDPYDAGLQPGFEPGALVVRQLFLAGARGPGHGRLVGCGRDFQIAVLLLHHGRQRAIVVVAAQGRIATGRDHLEDALGQAQDGDVEGAATQVVDRVDTLAGIVQAIGDRGRGGFVDQAQHMQARQPRRVLGGLALRIVEIRRHRDHGPDQVVAQTVFGPVTQRRQDVGTDLDRRFLSGRSVDGEHAGLVDEAVRQAPAVGHVLQVAAHEALDRGNRVLGITLHRLHGCGADLAPAIGQVTHDRRQDDPALLIGQAFGRAAAHRGNQRMGGAQVDADRQPALMRVRGLTGFGNLQ